MKPGYFALEALACLRAALAVFRQLGNTYGEAAADHSIGLAWRDGAGPGMPSATCAGPSRSTRIWAGAPRKRPWPGTWPPRGQP